MGNLGLRWTEIKATIGEYKGLQKNQEGRHWRVLRAEWNRTQHARGNNTRGLEYCQIWTQDSWYQKGSEEIKRIRIVSPNISTERAGGLEADLCSLNQGNINISVLQKKSGGSRSGVEIEIWIVDRENYQLRPERGKFCVENVTSAIVRHWGICANKQCAHRCTCGARARVGSEGSRGHHHG